MTLAEAGRLLAEDYHESHQRRKKLESHLKDLRRMHGGTTSMRIDGGLVTTFIESATNTPSQSWPNISVGISIGNTQETLSDITSDEADMAVVFDPIGSPELKRYSFQQGPICAVVPPQHPIA